MKNEKGNEATIQIECTQWFTETLQAQEQNRKNLGESFFFKKYSKAELNIQKYSKFR